MKATTMGVAQSIHVRLVRHAHELGLDPNQILSRYAAERFLYRLSRSPHAERFVLKGALLILAWLGETTRPTQDADLLGYGDISPEALAAVFREILALEVEPDGLTFDAASLEVEPIRAGDQYGGQRATIRALLGATRLRVQVDVGAGDAVEPAPELLEYPSLLHLPRPRLRAYRPETAIAEKLHAVVILGAANTRMRDFFDIGALAARGTFDGSVLAGAVRATFERRGTVVPHVLPLGLTPAFAMIEGKAAQWAGFMRRLPGSGAPAELASAVDGVAAFAGPVLLATGRGEEFTARWLPLSAEWRPGEVW